MFKDTCWTFFLSPHSQTSSNSQFNDPWWLPQIFAVSSCVASAPLPSHSHHNCIRALPMHKHHRYLENHLSVPTRHPLFFYPGNLEHRRWDILSRLERVPENDSLLIICALFSCTISAECTFYAPTHHNQMVRHPVSCWKDILASSCFGVWVPVSGFERLRRTCSFLLPSNPQINSLPPGRPSRKIDAPRCCWRPLYQAACRLWYVE